MIKNIFSNFSNGILTHSFPSRSLSISLLITAFTLFFLVVNIQLAQADAIDQAKRIHTRLTGINPTPAVLENMRDMIQANNALGAANLAMENPAFCNVMLRNFITPWTNEEFDPGIDLNDYTATVIGIIRDDIPFNQVLTEDIIYVGAAGTYSQTDNNHYIQLQNNGANLCDPTVLVRTTQSSLPDAPVSSETAAGIMTTRQAAKAFFSGGTNRAMWRFTGLHYLCRDMEQFKDLSRPSGHVRQDVSRSPGGESDAFLSHCVGCHSGMDALAGAFAYYNYDEDQERLVYTANRVQEKFLINSTTFEWGYVTQDDSWVNYWREGKNKLIGWDPNMPGKGNGAKSLGQEVANAEEFAACQVAKAFERVCFRPVETQADYNEAERITEIFKSSNYSFKTILAETAVYCRGN